MTNLLLGTSKKNNQELRISTKALTQHAAILGMTGSGKTGALLSLTEELIDKGIPVFLIDIKGDLANVALQDTRKMNFQLFTPGAKHGTSVNVFQDFDSPDRRHNAVSLLLKMCKEKETDGMSPKHIFLSKILEYCWDNKMYTDLRVVMEFILEPPFDGMGMLSLDEAMPTRSRNSLAAKINTLIAAPHMEAWLTGERLDFDSLFERADHTKVTVFSVAHLYTEEERTFAISYALDEMVSWMRRQPGASDLRAAVVIDECVGVLPPHPYNPPTKGAVMTILKQARAYGLGMVLASQNPMDVDYKAMGNCATWLVGRLQMAHDRKRVLDAVTAAQSHSREALEMKLSRLTNRQFLLVRQNACEEYTTKECTCELRGPMTPNELSLL